MGGRCSTRATLAQTVFTEVIAGLRRREAPPPVALHSSIAAAHGEVDAPPVGEGWPAGRHVRTGGDGTLRVKLAWATLELRPNSEVELVSPAHVRVLRGEVLAETAIGATALSLETSDVLVATATARFWVSPGTGCQGQTEIRVVSGAVTVTSRGASSVVSAEERWPSAQPCTEAAEVPAPPAIPEAPSRAPRARALSVDEPSRARPPAPLPPAPVVDALTRQNELYARAQAAAQAGRLSEALEQLEQLMREYPTGALAETALLEKVRWLKAAAPARAREAAQAYLDQFPRGVGRAEAEALVLEPP